MTQKIEIIRGTSNTMRLTVEDSGGNLYNLGSNEKIVFGVKQRPEDPGRVITKTASILGEGLFEVCLCPEDTGGLAPGKYVYDVGLDNGTDFFNVIEYSPFILIPNVTEKGCAN